MQICAIQLPKTLSRRCWEAQGIGFIMDSLKKCPERVTGEVPFDQIKTCSGSARAAVSWHVLVNLVKNGSISLCLSWGDGLSGWLSLSPTWFAPRAVFWQGRAGSWFLSVCLPFTISAWIGTEWWRFDFKYKLPSKAGRRSFPGNYRFPFLKG